MLCLKLVGLLWKSAAMVDKSYERQGIIGSDGVRRIYLLFKTLGNPCELTQLI